MPSPISFASHARNLHRCLVFDRREQAQVQLKNAGGYQHGHHSPYLFLRSGVRSRSRLHRHAYP